MQNEVKPGESKQEHFMRDLRKLLNLYGAEIWANDHWEGYGECGKDIRITVEFDDMRTQDLELKQFIAKDTGTSNAKDEVPK